MGKIRTGYCLAALVGTGCSAYAGYCNAKGIPMGHEVAMTYGNAIAHAAVGVPPFLFGAGLYALNRGQFQAGGGLGVAVCLFGGGALIGAGALESLIGYGAGYVIGRLS